MRVDALSVYAVPALLIFGAWLLLMVKIFVIDTLAEKRRKRAGCRAVCEPAGTFQEVCHNRNQGTFPTV